MPRPRSTSDLAALADGVTDRPVERARPTPGADGSGTAAAELAELRARYDTLYEEAARTAASAARSGERLARLQAVTAALSRAPTVEDVVHVVLEHALPTLRANSGAVLLLDDSRVELLLVHAVGFDAEAIQRMQHVPVEAASPTAAAVRGGRPMFLETVADWANPHGWPGASPVVPETPAPDASFASGAYAALPLLVDGRVLGALVLAFPAELRFERDDREFMVALARQGAQAIQRSRLYDAALAANRAKTDFLAVMSHELRTPLTAVVGYAELLADEVHGTLTPPQRAHLDRIRGSGEHLIILVEDILSYAKLEAGRARLHIAPCELSTLVGEVVAIIEPMVRKRALHFERHDVSVDAVMETDRGKVRQILINLLSNAVKYTEEGGVALTTRAEGPWVTFEVRDSGVGIASEHLERIFDAFWQVDQQLTRRGGGTGLGLSVARQLARILGGDISVASAPGVGSAFSVRLPLRIGRVAR